MITEETLAELERLSAACDPAPWTAVVEGRDAESGDSVIQTGPDSHRGEDIYVSRDSGPVGAEYLDLIAAARTYLPSLLKELRESRASSGRPGAAANDDASGETRTGPLRLLLVGYWAGPETTGDWPSPEDFVDPAWDQEERSLVADYLRQGHVVRAFMGWSRCRLCGENNGDLELTDGTFVWPSGLVHYVEDHDVRLPRPFVAHAEERTDRLEEPEYDEDWWRTVRPEPLTATAGADRARPPEDRNDSQLRTIITDDVGVPSGLVGREHVLRAVGELRRERADGSVQSWENNTLERFLGSFAELLAVVERPYDNTGRPFPSDPWVLVADALRGAREYE